MSRANFLGLNRNKPQQSPSHRRAREQEKELAKRGGGTLTPGSGNGAQKGDIMGYGGTYRVEAKVTKNKSFSVTRDMIRKIEEAALPNGELPAIIIEFCNDDGEPELEIAVVPTYALGGNNE